MKWTLAQTALADLLDIWTYTHDEWGATQADYYLDLIHIRFEWLVANPGLWRERSELFAGLHSIGAERHEVFFTGDSDGVRILRILHQSRDFSRHVQQDSD